MIIPTYDWPACTRCESAAHVEGETGRQEVIERRDWMHEDPGQWMRDMADWIIKEDGE